jgi:hypothetical protein
VKFFYGYVVTLAVLDAGVGEITQRKQNHDRDPAELQILADFARHDSHTPIRKLYALLWCGVKMARFLDIAPPEQHVYATSCGRLSI